MCTASLRQQVANKTGGSIITPDQGQGQGQAGAPRYKGFLGALIRVATAQRDRRLARAASGGSAITQPIKYGTVTGG
jgi:hypothetical protein